MVFKGETVSVPPVEATESCVLLTLFVTTTELAFAAVIVSVEDCSGLIVVGLAVIATVGLPLVDPVPLVEPPFDPVLPVLPAGAAVPLPHPMKKVVNSRKRTVTNIAARLARGGLGNIDISSRRSS